jgi:predicted oxidoreductase
MDYEWSLDNSKEISRGWIKRGKTVSDLANQIGVDSQVLEETVTGYNAFCKAGKDGAFSRAPDTLTTIETAPYYAISLVPSLLNTMGGPRRDRLARVIGNNGKPIPHLYSAGELGSIWGFLYEAAGNLTECLAFGRIAGRQAAAEEPWV